jgi:phage shock protein E
MKKIITLTLLLPLSLVGLTGCSTTSSSNGGNVSEQAAASSNPIVYSAVIDVRTLEEWNMGHLDNAIFASVEAPNFRDEIQKLDKSASYYIYCRTGNRAGQAIEIMKTLGFTGTLTNGGSLESASQATGLSIIFN